MVLFEPPTSGVFTLAEPPTPPIGEACPWGDSKEFDGPRYAEEGRARPNGSFSYGYGKVTTEERGSVVDVKTDARKRSVEADGASGVDGAGRVKLRVWTVDAGCNVEAMISTSRGNDSWYGRPKFHNVELARDDIP